MRTDSKVLARMARDMGLLPQHLYSVIRTAPLRYKVFHIPKRTGGHREIAQPAREVKQVQRWLIQELSQFLPIHVAVMAYQKNCSIKKNASAHVGGNYLLKMDIENFFPSIKAEDIELHLERYCGDRYTEADREVISRACTWAPNRKPPLRLCIGAPSSPLLSNSIMYEFDVAVSDHVRKMNVTYTRYADDLIFSCNEKDVLCNIEKDVFLILDNNHNPTLTVNTKKTVHASRACRQQVTGINLTPDGRLSVGREKKRLVRAMYHQYMHGGLDDKEAERMHGLLSFIEDVEPGFIDNLKRKYS